MKDNLGPILEEENNLRQRLNEIEPTLSSEDITIRQHNELEKEKDSINQNYH